MLEFNLKKKQARKELYYKKNNFVAELGIELINKKTDLILHKPNSSILFDERLKVKDSSNTDFIASSPITSSRSLVIILYLSLFDISILFNS